MAVCHRDYGARQAATLAARAPVTDPHRPASIHSGRASLAHIAPCAFQASWSVSLPAARVFAVQGERRALLERLTGVHVAGLQERRGLLGRTGRPCDLSPGERSRLCTWRRRPATWSPAQYHGGWRGSRAEPLQCRRRADETPRHATPRRRIQGHAYSPEAWTVQHNRTRASTRNHRRLTTAEPPSPVRRRSLPPSLSS